MHTSQESATQHGPAAGCRTYIESFDTLVASTHDSDHGSHRIKGYPYLRSNRFLASFNQQINDTQAFNYWVEKLRQQALKAWQYELNNLDKSQQEQLLQQAHALNENSTHAALDNCSQLLVQHELRQDSVRRSLYAGVQVPDSYRTWQRVLGLYPFVGPFFKLGILDWHDKTRTIHALDYSAQPLSGQLIRYQMHNDTASMNYAEVEAVLESATTIPLGIPEPAPHHMQALFATYAPVFEVDTVTNHDRIGTIRLSSKARPYVDTADPVFYRYASYTRLQGKILLQLNYMIWFPSRPKTSPVDLLGGELDGLIWRVTLLPDGKPLLFDSIHLCGCYHLLFPTQYATVKTSQVDDEEPLLFLEAISISETTRMHIRIASGTHYIDDVAVQGNPVSGQRLVGNLDKDVLRSMPAGDEHASLYDAYGIIKASVRLERFFFWPMGVISPGAMRQPGQHATAFVGRRHFDDAFLLEPYLAISIDE